MHMTSDVVSVSTLTAPPLMMNLVLPQTLEYCGQDGDDNSGSVVDCLVKWPSSCVARLMDGLEGKISRFVERNGRLSHLASILADLEESRGTTTSCVNPAGSRSQRVPERLAVPLS